MFSHRLNWDAPLNSFSLLLEEKRRAGAAVLDLTESNPTRAGFRYPERSILDALSNPAALRYDPDPRGLKCAREAVSRYYAQRGTRVDPSQILLTSSTSEAYAYLFKALANPGDEVLIPRPSYPLFEFLARLESVVIRSYSLRYDGAWHMDFQSLENAIGSRTRALVVVNPNNPTGSFVKYDEAQQLQAFARARDLAIVSDEVFSDYAFDEELRRTPTLFGSGGALTFCLSGLSKIAGLPQMKLAWIACSGKNHEAALRKMEWLADTYLSVGAPVQAALFQILEASAEVRNQIRRRIASNLAFLRERTNGSRAGVLDLEAGWYAILRVPQTRTEEEWVTTLLTEKDVVVQPGFFYDFESEGFLVLSLLTKPETFQEGVRRLVFHL
ncbi:MAG TPA: pyridoxal phosphate-dependent aminotransferase [Bryobacteraceae bacterium]|nr:pyridoxal phosphate-dependent aminotransferase [Bryobacteraceae bacterium]